MFAVSEAKSVSVMRLFEADRFSVVEARFEIAELKLLDRLHQLRRHHQRLALLELQFRR